MSAIAFPLNMFYRLRLTKHTSFTIFPSTTSCMSTFPDLNLNKSLETHVRYMYSKILFQLSIHSQFILLTHSRIQRTCDKIVKHIIYIIYDKASLESSEEEVKSLPLRIPETHFIHCFLLLPEILHLFRSSSKTFLH